MIKQFNIKTGILALMVGLIFSGPIPLYASHNDSEDNDDYREYRRPYSVSNSKLEALGDDIEEEFAIPVLFGVTLKNIISDFGDPRGDGTRSHEGQDMLAILGTPIVSPTKAVVIRTGSGDSSGNYVYTANPGGETFRYMHLDEIADIESGDVLNEGDFIGTVGDTGNAKGGAAHLHFEIRDGEAIDPYPRIQEEFSLEEKIEFVNEMFNDLDDEYEMAEFLVETYLGDFRTALNAGYELPDEISEALEERGIVNVSDLVSQLEAIIASIPKVVTKDLVIGDQGIEVSLVQVFLTYGRSGSAASALSNTGATGYFGSVTEAAVREYQAEEDIEITGAYDAATRAKMSK